MHGPINLRFKKWGASTTLGVTDDIRHYYVYCLLHFSNWWYRLTLLNAVAFQNLVMKMAFCNLIYNKITVGNIIVIQERSLHFTFSISKDGHRSIMRVQNYDYYLILMGTAVAEWLRYCATNRKVAGSIPAEILYWHKILSIALWPWGRLSL